MQEALAYKESDEAKTIAFNLCGYGHFDLASYDAYMQGKLVWITSIQRSWWSKSLANLPQVG